MCDIKQLLGQYIERVQALEWQSYTIEFDRSRLHIMNPITIEGKESLEAFAGHYVAELFEKENREFLIILEDRSKISVSLLDEDFSGPEAMVYYGEENLIVVWQLGESSDCHLVYEG